MTLRKFIIRLEPRFVISLISLSSSLNFTPFLCFEEEILSSKTEIIFSYGNHFLLLGSFNFFLCIFSL